MVKNRASAVFITALFLILHFNNTCFAIENADKNIIYPDYACEFSGKDKCEKFNRKLFIFNLKLNRCIVRPVNIVWASVMPKYGMDRIQNAYNNINYPVRLVSCLLQKDFKASKKETIRFITNTTIGIGGLYDKALTKYNIEPVQEDMGQALAKTKIKRGPYLVLPVVRGNVRDLVGQLLDYALRPTSYIGPICAGATAIFTVNNMTYLQPIIKKIDENYADPYELTKQIDGVDRYIKNFNLDRAEVFAEKTASQNIIKVSNFSEPASVKADIELNNYNPQGPLVDSLRTAMFDNQKLDASAWSEMSVWNKTFVKRLKISSVNIVKNSPDYKYRYILQKNKTSPLAIIYPSIGDGIQSDKSVVLAKFLYDEGYSVLIQGSAFNWEFIKSMPNDYKPGLPYKDAEHLSLTTSKIIDSIEKRKGYKFNKKILVGCSFGALTGIFVASQEEQKKLLKEKTIGISNYIAINPPIEIMYSLHQLDKYTQDWKNDPSDIKMRTAITAEKAINLSKSICNKEIKDMKEVMPFTDDEAKLVIGFIMKQKLSDVIFSIEHCSRGKQSDLYKNVNSMSFDNYAQKYLFTGMNKTPEEINYETSLYAVSDYLQNNKNYKIYQTLDDYFVNQEQLCWLKNKTNSILFSNGSHLGCMYRKEFIDEFKKDISLQENIMVNDLKETETIKTAQAPLEAEPSEKITEELTESIDTPDDGL